MDRQDSFRILEAKKISSKMDSKSSGKEKDNFKH